MPVFILLVVFLLFPVSVVATEAEVLPVEQRLTAAMYDAQQVITGLLDNPATTLTAEDWMVLAEAYLTQRNKDAAIDAINKALQSDDDLNKARALLIKARIYGILYRDTALAMTQLEEARQILQPLNSKNARRLHSDVLQNFAQAYNQSGNLTQAIPLAEQSLALAITLDDSEREMKARLILGRLALQNNAYSTAYLHLHRALALASALNDAAALASIHFRLGMAYRKIDEHQLALEHLLQARERYLQLGKGSSYIFTLLYIAESYLEDPEYAAQAATYFDEAYQLAKSQNDLVRMGIVQQGLGRLAMLQNDPGTARQHYSEARQIFRQQGLKTYLQESTLALAELFFQQQQLPETDSLLAELHQDMGNAAAYLQARYAGLVAKLAAHREQWIDAYQSGQKASELRFQSLADQHKTKFNLMKTSLEQFSVAESIQQELQQQQHMLQQSQQRNQYLFWGLVLLLLLLAAVCVLLIIIWLRGRAPLAVTTWRPDSWTSFCNKALQEQKAGNTLYLLAFTLNNYQQLKWQAGEQHIRRTLQHFLSGFHSPYLKSCCINSDVLWLILDSPAEQAPVLQQQFHALLLNSLQPWITAPDLVSVLLPVTALLGKQWTKQELTALREAVWLSWYLTEQNLPDEPGIARLIELRTGQTRPCEWQSDGLRQDLLNAFSLGTLTLFNQHRPIAIDITELS
ncbi:hypothetical protein QE250_12635 [Chromatiaceae bacterium AAb-1]|nr:hypothetical protein [Chromatiaceae bacterium AAb-1]